MLWVCGEVRERGRFGGGEVEEERCLKKMRVSFEIGECCRMENIFGRMQRCRSGATGNIYQEGDEEGQEKEQ